jgi:hypothetical protein
VKAGDRILRFGPDRPIDDDEIRRYLLHPGDGFLNVPVLVRGDLVVRGYTEALYAEALGGDPPPAAGAARPVPPA